MRALRFSVTVALVVLVSRALVYAAEPSPLARELAHDSPGPRPLLVAAVVLALALGASAAVLWLAALGVRERHAVVGGERPRLRSARIVAHAAALCVASSLAFALVESFLHWRAGLGFHGLHCLLGPVHRDALPFLAAFSAVAAALSGAAAHVLAWTRRTLALLRRAQIPRPLVARVQAAVVVLPASLAERPGKPRGPPPRRAVGTTLT